LRMLGVTNAIEKREIVIRYSEKFGDYLVKDRVYTSA